MELNFFPIFFSAFVIIISSLFYLFSRILKKKKTLPDSMKPTLLVDVRTFKEYGKGRARTAIFVPWSFDTKDLKEIKESSFECSKLWRKFKERRIYTRFVFYGNDKNSVEYVRKLFEEDLNHPRKVFVSFYLFDYFKEYYPFLITSEEKKAVTHSFPAEIIDNFLYLGSKFHARNTDVLKLLGITHIVNTAGELGNYNEEVLVHCNMDGIDDDEDEDLNDILDEGLKFLEDCRENKKKVLVHCNMGISRSTSTVLAYLMKTYKWTYEESYKLVLKARPIVRPNKGFVRQLKAMESHLLE